MKPIFCATLEEARLRASEALQAVLREKKQLGTPVLLLLSGGSAFSILESVSHGILGPHMTIGVLDERYSTDENVNNFSQFTHIALYASAFAVGARFIDTRVKNNETQKQLGMRFETDIWNWLERNSAGVIVATMGIGVDGHIAGIMPFPENSALFQELFEDDTKLVVAYDAGDKNRYPLRITVTLPFLRRYVNHAIMYAVGEEKNAAVRRVFTKEGSLTQTPARVVHEMKDVKMYSISFISGVIYYRK